MSAGATVEASARTCFLEEAGRIGQRLARDAIWSGGRCTWIVRVPDPSVGPAVQRTVEAPAGPFLYQGSAGIALFLGEFARLTADAGCRRAAVGGIRHALDEARSVPPAFLGLYTGRTGVAYASARVGVCLGEPDLVNAAWTLLEASLGRETDDDTLDVIGGSAGALLAFLTLAGGALSFRRETLLAAAERMGDHLIRTARVEPVGWSWPDQGPPGRAAQARNLTGYAHGASGFAHALVELFRVTGRMKYRYATRQALRYERRWYDAERGNWPDFRHMDLLRCLSAGGLDAVRERLREGRRPFEPFRPTFMSAWCHGAPGIGLARLRTFEVIGDRELREEAHAAVATTVASFGEGGGITNHGLCHGRFGNAETLLFAAELFEDSQGRAQAEALAAEACEGRARPGQPWMSGTAEELPDPSLMLGDAGVGHFMLRLHDPCVPSVLCLTSDGLRAAEWAGRDEADRLADVSVDRFFEATRRAFVRLGALPPNGSAGLGTTDHGPAEAFDELRGIVTREDDLQRKAVLDGVFRPERVRYERTRDAGDATATYLELLARDDAGEVDWPASKYRLSQRTCLVTGSADGSGAETDQEGQAGGDVLYVVYKTPEGVELQALRGFAAAVLVAAREATTVDATCAGLGERFARPQDRELLRTAVVEQVAAAYRGGIVEIVGPDPSGRSGDP